MTGLVLVALHVLANLVWIGSIVAVGFLIAKSKGPEAKGFGTAARQVYRSLAAPAFGISFILGIMLVARDAATYFKQGWFHGKLTAALVVIALHHVIGARAKKADEGALTGDGGAQVMTLVLVLAAAAAVFFVTVRPF